MSERDGEYNLPEIRTDLPGEISVQITGMKLPIISKDGIEIDPGNLETPKIMDQVVDKVGNAPWYEGVLEDIKHDRRHAIFITTIKGITIIVAAAGIEFGLRHGKDIQKLKELIEAHKAKKSSGEGQNE